MKLVGQFNIIFCKKEAILEVNYYDRFALYFPSTKKFLDCNKKNINVELIGDDETDEDIEYYLLKEDAYYISFVTAVGTFGSSNLKSRLEEYINEGGVQTFFHEVDSKGIDMLVNDLNALCKKVEEKDPYTYESKNRPRIFFTAPLIFNFQENCGYDDDYDVRISYKGIFKFNFKQSLFENVI